MTEKFDLDTAEAVVTTDRLSPTPTYTGWQAKVSEYFYFPFYKTNFRTEILAGLTTFMTMAYVMVVHPSILSSAIFLNTPRDLFSELVVVTGISAVLGTFIMGLLAKYPFVLAPGMGTNAYFAYSVVLGLGISWRTALAAVFVQGIIFLLLTVSDIRRHLITAVPNSIKSATTAGIGMFLAYLGLASSVKTGGAGLIVANEVTKTAFGSFREPATLLALFGIVITCFFMLRRIKGALLWGIGGTAILGWILGVAAPPQGIIAIPQWPSHLFGQALVGLSEVNLNNLIDFAAIILVFLFVDMFDTIGTLAGIGNQAGYIDENGELPRANEALMADAIATTAGGVLGTSTIATFAESAAGVAEGGRTGFTAIVAGILFLGALFFVPIFEAIPAFATTPSLLIVGVLMMAGVKDIHWDDLTEAIPAFLTIFLIPLGFSIAAGLSAGMVFYPFCKLAAGRAREVSIATWILGIIFLVRYVFTTIRFG